MKFELKDVLAVAGIAVAAVGFYAVGRYHEEYLNEKRQANAEVPTEEPVSEAE
jgi:hypothetical protein